MYLKLRSIQKIKEGILPNPFCTAKTFLIPEPKTQENYRTILFLNINAKSLIKY